jgi:hypothetical protein
MSGRYHSWMLVDLHNRHYYEEMLSFAFDTELRTTGNCAQEAIAVMAEEAVSA